jgi:hypothetical protein
MMHLDDNAYRLNVLKALVLQLGIDAYPALIKILVIVSESSEVAVKIRIAQTFGYAAQCGDLPKGEMNAWGVGRSIAEKTPVEPVTAGNFMRNYWTGTATRGLGPVEYLTVWYSQKTQRPYLTEAVYVDALTKVISLISSDAWAATCYSHAILLDLDTRMEGAFTRQTRLRLTNLANAWQKGAAPHEIAWSAL